MDKLDHIAKDLKQIEPKRSDGTVAIWGYLIGKSNEDLVIRVADCDYFIRSDNIKKFQTVSEENGIEVFVLVDDSFEFRTTAKDVAKLAGSRRGDKDVPFALSTPERAPSHEYTSEEMEKFEKEYNDWRNKVGLLEEFAGPLHRQCTLTNTKLVTSCGVLDVGMCPDGSQGDGCEGY